MIEEDNQIDTISLMFEAARSYLGGAKIIMESEGIEDDHGSVIPTLPVTTCLALAIEIQLKALLIVHAVERPKGDGHDLMSLFKALPQCVQSEILEFQEKVTDFSEVTFMALIEDEKDTFKTWRYPYERPMLETQPAAMYHVALALSEYLKSSRKIERSDNGWMRKS